MKMQNERYITRGQSVLRCGYTTGTCAAAASKAATAAFLSQCTAVSEVDILLPGGERTCLAIADLQLTSEYAICGVIKDAGDDPDVTNGMMICAKVSPIMGDERVVIDGGVGVGRVTMPGLDQGVGQAAINSMPRQMIAKAVLEEMETRCYEGNLKVEISIPGGEEIARQTLNGALGIEGGLSILGTSGIVEPMSEQALIDTIAVEMRMRCASGSKRLILAPGNYGLDFLQTQYGITKDEVIKISNFVGESIDLAVLEGVEEILLVGHVGKLVKVAGGIMNTHSHHADARMEILTAYAALAGLESEKLIRLMRCVTTDAGLAILQDAGVLSQTMELILERIEYHLNRRAGGKMRIGLMVFSNVYGLLGKNAIADEILRENQS